MALLAAACGTSGNDYSIRVTAPPAGGAVADHSYIITWTLDVPEINDAYVNLYADTDIDPSTVLVLLEDSIDVVESGWVWHCDSFPEDQYFIRAVLYHGADDESDYSDGTITITHGPLGDVQGIAVVADSCFGTSVYVAWNALAGAASYDVFFSADGVDPWEQIGETTGQYFIHDAPGAGTYGVKGVRESETSPGYGNPAGTMPLVFADSLATIWDNLAPAGSFTAVQLTPCGAQLRFYDDTAYNIYCYQAGQPYPPCLFSGDAPPVGNGFPTSFAPAGANPSIAPEYGYSDSILVEAGDVLFGVLETQNWYVKVLVQEIPVNPDVAGSRGVSFTYEFQSILGLRLFTSAIR
jgi:hypothetical protein